MNKTLGQNGLNFIASKYKELKELITKKADKSEIKTKLSELTDDSTHRTVTDTEKTNWDKKFDLPNGKVNQVLTKTDNGSEFKDVPMSKSATFVIANYDSSENSKASADYVVKETDCAIEIINSFIAKLPSYGGQIQLTEGNFQSKKDLSVMLNKSNTTLRGYGCSTNLVSTQTKNDRTGVLVFIPSGVSNCELACLNISHNASNSINIKGDGNTVRKIRIINNGDSPSVVLHENTKGNQVHSCHVENKSSFCYWILKNSTDNAYVDCFGTSGDGDVFYVEGTGHRLENCKGISPKQSAFYLSGDNINLTNCVGENAPDGDVGCFRVFGKQLSLSACRSKSTRGSAYDLGGKNNKLMGCFGESDASSAFFVYGERVDLTNCSGVSKGSSGIYISGKYSQASHCSGVSSTRTGILVTGKSVRLMGCVGKTLNPKDYYDIKFDASAATCCAIGNGFYVGRVSTGSETNTIVYSMQVDAFVEN